MHVDHPRNVIARSLGRMPAATLRRVGFVALALSLTVACTGASVAETPTTSASQTTTPSVQLDGPAPTAEDLDGTWSLDDGDHMLRFDADDGTYAIDDTGNLDSDPDDTGSYSLSGSTLTFVTEDSRVCDPGQRWVWEVELLEDGHMHGVVTLDECLDNDADWTWTRVSP